ncbi:GTP-binding protein [Rhodopseudomonas palustris]|uniref:CobW family GTP-binding protein n=1 Tax=Rhodopseudomonas palustris TaxID=1076 RepID=UPI002ACE096F|nr:GTP-binding protein [Rhodopseudomonas palustris]WQG99820.1 GTP-binding protein [Rhodopseudomonas palustris]
MTRIPLVLLTGFLGSGKTTLLNALLAGDDFCDTAVVINEAGDVGLDHLLVEQGADTVTLLDGGCLCCRAKGSLAPTLEGLLRRSRNGSLPPFRRMVVETSGLSDPAAVLEQLIPDGFFNHRIALAGVVTVVDARVFLQTVQDHPEARMQVALADRLLISKADIVGEADVAAVQRELTAINPHAQQIVVHPSAATLEMVWPDALDLPRAATRTRGPACTGEPPPIVTASHAFDGAIDPDLLDAWLDHTLGLLGPMLLRMKAMLDIVGSNSPTVLHAVQGLLHKPADLAAWPVAGQRNRIVLIGRDVDQQVLVDAIDRLAIAARRQVRTTVALH